MERKHVALKVKCITFKVSETGEELFNKSPLGCHIRLLGSPAVIEALVSDFMGFDDGWHHARQQKSLKSDVSRRSTGGGAVGG